ncbi:MAG TPA: hypothetical protein PKE04_03185, partial [Clostridia bacterium]|nr:hypothetical protein [Clostridia bacterium]
MQRRDQPKGRGGRNTGPVRQPGRAGSGRADRRIPSVQMSSGVRMPKPSGRQRMRRVLQRMVIGAALLAALLLAVYGISQSFGRNDRPTRLGCLPSDRIEAFGEDVLYYNNGTLTCAGAGGNIRWTFQLGNNANFYAADRMVVAWSANQLYVINASGASTYNNRMTSNVQFARIGATYVAAYLGDEDEGTIQVMNHQGTFVESVAVSNVVLTDIGFFGNRGQRMWTLGLDVLGTAPTTTLSTYESGRQMATGAASISDRMVYRIYLRDSYLMLVDTQSVTAYDYKCTPVPSLNASLIYGWQYSDSREIGKECYTLLHPMPDDDGTVRMRSMRLITKSGDAVLRLPTQCFAGVLGSRCLYAFSQSAVYYARYGQTRFRSENLNFPLERVIA